MSDMNINEKNVNLTGLKAGLKRTDLKTEAQKLIFDALNTNAVDNEIDINETEQFGANFDTNKKKEVTDEQITKFLQEKNLEGVKIEDFKEFLGVWTEKSSPTANSNEKTVKPNDNFDTFLDSLANDRFGTFDKLLMLFDSDNNGKIDNVKYNVQGEYWEDHSSEREQMQRYFKELTGKDEIPTKKDLKSFAKKLNKLSDEKFNTIKQLLAERKPLPENIRTELNINKSHVKLKDLRNDYEIAGKKDIMNAEVPFLEIPQFEIVEASPEDIEEFNNSIKDSEENKFINKIKKNIDMMINVLSEGSGNRLDVEKFEGTDVIKKQVITDSKGDVVYSVEYNKSGTVNTILYFDDQKCERTTFDSWTRKGECYEHKREIFTKDMKIKYSEQRYNSEGTPNEIKHFNSKGQIIDRNIYVNNGLRQVPIEKYFYNNDNSYSKISYHYDDISNENIPPQISSVSEYNSQGQLIKETMGADVQYDDFGNIAMNSTEDTITLEYEYGENGEILRTTKYNSKNVRILTLEGEDKKIYYDESGKIPLYYTINEPEYTSPDPFTGITDFDSYKTYSMDGKLLETHISEREQNKYDQIQNLNLDNYEPNGEYEFRDAIFDLVNNRITDPDYREKCFDKLLNILKTPNSMAILYPDYYGDNGIYKNQRNIAAKNFAKLIEETKSEKNIDAIRFELLKRPWTMATDMVDTPNGKVDKPHYQGAYGDCWCLEPINGLLRTNQGKKLVNRMITTDKKTGDVVVSLEGGKVKYRIKMEELIENQELSRGDYDMRALEVAFIRYNKDIGKRGDIDGGDNDDVINVLETLTGNKRIGNVKFENNNIIANIDGEEVQLNPKNIDKFKNRPFDMPFTKECLESLRQYKDHIVINFSAVLGPQGSHEYSLEFNDDGTVTLHEPHNSQNNKIMTIDELFDVRRGIRPDLVVMIL